MARGSRDSSHRASRLLIPGEQLYPGKNARLARVMAETAPSDPRPFWKDADEVGPILEGKYMEATLVRNELPVQEAMRRAMAEIRTFYAARA